MRKKRHFVSVTPKFWERVRVIGKEYGFEPGDLIREVLEETFDKNLPCETENLESAMFR